MLTTLFKSITSWFKPKNPWHSGAEAFIVSKNPTNGADVEYWMRVYETKRANGIF